MATFKKMSGFKEAAPKGPPTDVQCSAETFTDPRQRARMVERYKRLRPHYDPDKCQRCATVTVNGKPMCKIHAGRIALREMLK